MSSAFERFLTSSWFITDWSSSSASATTGAGTQGTAILTKRAHANNYDDEVLAIIALAGNYCNEQDNAEDPTTEHQHDGCNTTIKRRRTSRNGFARWTNPDGSYIRLVLRILY
jgi:hypothetical protein